MPLLRSLSDFGRLPDERPPIFTWVPDVLAPKSLDWNPVGNISAEGVTLTGESGSVVALIIMTS